MMEESAYLESLRKTIAELPPADQAAAWTMLAVGQLLAEYINRRDWDAVKGLQDVAAELFTQAWGVLAAERARMAQ